MLKLINKKGKGYNFMNMVIVEGLIGAGKTTFVRAVAERYKEKIATFFEAVDDNPYLSKFYKEPGKYALVMQFWLMSKRYQQHLNGVKEVWSNKKISLFDRSIYGDRVFLETLHRDGFISEQDYNTYNLMRDQMFRTLLVPQYMIWLDAKPKVCLERIKIRSRDCETTITIEYLEKLQETYQGMLWEMKKLGSQVIRIPYDEGNLEEAIDIFGNEVINSNFSLL